jgi:hypothetical protein
VTVSSEGSGFRGFTLAHDVSSPEDVDRVLQQAVDAGASLVKPGQEVFWGVLTQHGSCDEGVRSFCGSCGSQLTYEKRSTPQQLDIALATLDDASGLHPECHIWTSHKLPWVSLGEELPVYDEWSMSGRERALRHLRAVPSG